MRIVDSHCHVSTGWYEPVETLLYQMDQNGVEQAILIQMMGQYDNTYQTECVRRYPGRFASVVLVDPNSPNAVQSLERLAEEGASGVRLRASTRSSGDDPLAIWRAAERLGLAVSCAGSLADFTSDAFVAVLQAVPRLPIVIEHLGSATHANSTPDTWRKLFDLARFSNAYMKIHGLGEFCKRALPVANAFPFERPIPPLLDLAYDAFGPKRLMWGSDYPPVSGREGYRNALRLTLEQFANRSEEDRRSIFGEVALAVFPIRG